jgi:hypothetical protein
MLFVAGLLGFAWWTYVFLPLVYFLAEVGDCPCRLPNC